MWNKKYEVYRFKSICDKLKVAFKPCHKFTVDLGGYAEQDSDGLGSDRRCAGTPNTRENDKSEWIQVKYKNSPKTRLTSPIKNFTMHNAYGILSQSNDPIPDNKTIFVDLPPSQQDANVCKHHRQRKIARRQHIKLTLHLLSKNKNLFLDNSITQAKDEQTVLVKGDQTNLQRLAIDPAHVNSNYRVKGWHFETG